MKKNKNVLVIGTGSIGQRHYKIFSEIFSFNTYIKSSSSIREQDLKNRLQNI